MTPSPGPCCVRPRTRMLTGTACAVALLLTGCAGDHSTPDPWTPSAPPATTPASPVPSSDTPDPDIQATVPTASAQLLLQAKQLYMQYYTYETTLERQGGADQLPAPMAALLTGHALDDTTKIMQQAKKAGVHWVDGTPQYQVVKVAQLLQDVPNGTVIALQACEQSGGAKLALADGTKLSDGATAIFMHQYFMGYNDEHDLVIFNITGGSERMTSCPF